jgi:peptide deformylase
MLKSRGKELTIVKYPAEILKAKGRLVKFPLDEETKELISDMWVTVKGKGVGLAAQQVGVDKQICVINLSEDAEGMGKNTPKKDFVMINPRINFYSDLQNSMVEGCLSFPGEYYEISRPANIQVEYYDEKGKKRKLMAKEWLSRVIQHEADHLFGKLFIEYGGKKIDEEKIAAERNND